MKIKITLSIILIVLLFVISEYASASSYIDCQVKAKIIKVNKKPDNSKYSYIYLTDVTVKYIRIIQRGGHARGHDYFDDIVGTTENIKELQIRDKNLLDKIKEGEIVYITYGSAFNQRTGSHEIRELIEIPKKEKLNQKYLKLKKKNGLYGYVDKNDKFIIEAKYTIANEFTENGVAFVADKKDWYLINKNGEILLNPYIIDGKPDKFVENRARFIKDGKFGFYNNCGEIVYFARYDYIFPMKNKHAIAVKDCKLKKDGNKTIVEGGKWGMLSNNGGLALNFEYKKVFPYKYDKIKAITFENEKKYFNSWGSELHKMDKRELKVKEKNGKYGYVDESGKFVIKPKYISACGFNLKNVTGVLDKDGWHIINKDGKKLFKPFIFDNVPDEFVNGFARFVKDGKMGFYNEFGEVVVEAKYDFVDVMKNYIAPVNNGCKFVTELEVTTCEGGKWGLINYQGKVIVPIKYKEVDNMFIKGKVKVIDFDGNTLYYNWKGEIVK